MSSGREKGISDNVLRMEMEQQMTEEERIVIFLKFYYVQLAAKMARIAELAEKKNAAPKSNPVLKQIKGPSRTPSIQSKTQINSTVPFFILILVQTQEPKKVVFLSKAQREKMKKEEEEKKKAELAVWSLSQIHFQEKKKQLIRRNNEFSREETLENERREQEEREERERKRQREAEEEEASKS